MNPHRKTVDNLLTRYRTTVQQCRDEKDALEKAEEHLGHLAVAQGLVQSVAERVQEQAHKQIAKIVTECLAVFDEPYEFRIDFQRARGRTEAHLVFERDGHEVDPISASGGGCVDVAAFALRLACLVLRKPRLRRLLVLDEPMRFPSIEYRRKIAALISLLSEKLGVQVIMVTHDPLLVTGKVIEL